MPILDEKANFGVSTILAGFDEYATQISVAEPERFPAVPFNATIHNAQTYANAADDPDREIVRVTAKSGDTFTLDQTAGHRNAFGGTTPHAHNTSGAVYKLDATIYAEDLAAINDAAIDVGTKYCWITEVDFGAMGDGVTDDYTAFNTAVAAGYTFIVVPAGTYRIGTSIVFASTITLQMLPGAILMPDTGITVTINGFILAGNYTWSGGSGTVTVALRQQLYGCPSRKVIQSAEQAGDAIAGMDVVIAHGLTYTPVLADVLSIATIVSSGYSAGDPPYFREPYVHTIDATNITVRAYVMDAGATGTKFRVTVTLALTA